MRLLLTTTSLVLLLAAAVRPCGLAAAPADSARTDTMSVLIEGLEIFGTRPVTKRGGTSETRASIDSLALPAAASAEQVLQSLPAIHVRTNSRGEAELSVRGSESRQVAVLFDGMPLTLSWDRRTDLSVIPAGALQQVTLVRGLSTLLAGPNVLGGVVEFQTGAAGGAATLPLALTAGAIARYTGAQYAIDPDAGSLARLPARTRVDLELSRAWAIGDGWLRRLHTRLAAENVTDEAIYDSFGLPEPGRTFRFDVRVQ